MLDWSCMRSPPPGSPLQALPSAFAAACRQARSDSELFQRCRDALATQFHTEQIWFTVQSPTGTALLVGATDGFAESVEVARCASGGTELIINVDPSAAPAMRSAALPLAHGLSVVLELRSVLLERQGMLDDALFQLRALRQVARLLSSAHSTEDTEHLALDFMSEVFFAWWATLYRPSGEVYHPLRRRSTRDDLRLGPIGREALDGALLIGSPVGGTEDVAMRSLLPAGTELAVPLDMSGERLGLLLLGPRMNGRPYGKSERELAGTLAFAAAIALKNAELVERLHSAATTDELTGLFNRRALEERLEAEISRSTRHQIRTTVVLFDIDRFKTINDTLGHAGGDRYLSLIGQLVTRYIRSLDVAGRLGGDEFLVILPMTTIAEARVFVQRLQRGLQEFSAEHPEFGHSTVSIGLAETPRHGATVADLLAAADSAMYAAKRAGRDSVRTAGEHR